MEEWTNRGWVPMGHSRKTSSCWWPSGIVQRVRQRAQKGPLCQDAARDLCHQMLSQATCILAPSLVPPPPLLLFLFIA